MTCLLQFSVGRVTYHFKFEPIAANGYIICCTLLKFPPKFEFGWDPQNENWLVCCNCRIWLFCTVRTPLGKTVLQTDYSYIRISYIRFLVYSKKVFSCSASSSPDSPRSGTRAWGTRGTAMTDSRSPSGKRQDGHAKLSILISLQNVSIEYII